MHGFGSVWILAIAMAAVVPAAGADLSGSDREQVKQTMQGSLYLRTTIPVRYKVGFAGAGPVVLTEISPTSVDFGKNMPAPAPKKKHPRDAIYWGLGPNEPVGNGKLYFKGGGVVDWWGEGLETEGHREVIIRFVQINTADDFNKAFDLVFSRKPLQEEHPEWPQEIRNAIAAKKIVEGMTKPQAFAVVGTPVAVEKSEEGGKVIETWSPRQDLGTVILGAMFFFAQSETSLFPTSIRFVDGKVVSFSGAASR